jgi:hypothetical protein
MKTPTTIDNSLRNRAERKLCSIGVASSDMSSNTDDKKLLHELQVHQVELEMQNEELCQERELSEIAEICMQNYMTWHPSHISPLTQAEKYRK